MRNVQKFFQEVRSEFSKIVWPSYDELIGSLVIVIFLVALFSLFLGSVDFVFYHLAKYVFKS